jgi:hypothetical protein
MMRLLVAAGPAQLHDAAPRGYGSGSTKTMRLLVATGPALWLRNTPMQQVKFQVNSGHH